MGQSRSDRRIWLMKISEYVENKAAKSNFPFKIIDGVGHIFYKGKWEVMKIVKGKVVHLELEALFPTPNKLYKITNCDTSKSWIYEE